jgi:hypothetical protein
VERERERKVEGREKKGWRKDRWRQPAETRLRQITWSSVSFSVKWS